DDAGTVVVNAVHCGVGGIAVQRAAPLKPVLGRAAYRLGAALAGATSEGWRVEVEVDGHLLADGQVLFVGIGNGATIGGGTVVWPDARLDDGVVDVVVGPGAAALSRLQLAAALRSGDPGSVDGIVVGRGRSVRVEGEAIPSIADGELCPPSPLRTWQVQPAAWHLLAPCRTG
ncbi:MAG: diacylglycerol/lipid kinase family protein, partial [Actinomycetes bacterium]